MSSRRRDGSWPPPTLQRQPYRAQRSPVARFALYLCCAVETIFAFGDSVGMMPWTRLVESIICQRHAGVVVAEGGAHPSFYRVLSSMLLIGGKGGPTAEARCKGDVVQAEMAELFGGIAGLGSIPGLFLVLPFIMLAKHVDRRLLLVVNAVGLIGGNLFMILLVLTPNVNLKLLWLAGLFTLFGGGGPVFITLLRSIIAESVQTDELSSVLYVLSGINMLARLSGVALGSWLLQYGAVAANFSSVALLSVSIPILTLLPHSVARAPRTKQRNRAEEQLFKQKDIGLQHLIPKAASAASEEAEAEQDAPYQDRGDRSQRRHTSFIAAIREFDYAGTAQKYTHLPVHNPLCIMFLVIMFANSLVVDARDQVKAWISTRYGWPLADVGYVLSVESLAGVAVLFALPWLDRVRRRPLSGPRSEDGRESEDLVMAILEKRKRELRVTRFSLGFGTVGALIIALAAHRAMFVTGLVVLTGSVGFPEAVRAFCTSSFAAGEIQALYAGVTVVEMLGVILGSPAWGWIFAQAYHGGSTWIGLPFVIYMVLLLGMLGLMLRLKP